MPNYADIIITNAKVFTVDPTAPHAEAVAISGSRIAFVGEAKDTEQWRGPAGRIIDGQGCTLMPGFIDSHFHLMYGSMKLGDIQLDKVNSLDTLAGAILEFAHRHPDQHWLVGQGLRYTIPSPTEPLTRHHLDAIIADRPLVLMAYDVHTAWANTEALRRAGILFDGEATGPNSEIIRDDTGEATGEMVEPGAYNLVLNLIPPPTGAKKQELLKQGLALVASMGLTSVHNMDGNAEQLALYNSLESTGDLTLRVYLPFDVKPDTPPEGLAKAVEMRRSCQGDMLKSGCVKFFMDGVIETYTGLLVDDYAGAPGNKGDALFSAENFTQMATEADKLGLQIFVHAVGDGAVRRVLDGYQAAKQTNGRRDSRHRVEHIELIHPDDLPRFAELGVIASMQPAHSMLTGDEPDPWLQRIPQSRWSCSFAWESPRRAGATLAFGSDWPVADLNPMLGMHYALNRQSWAPGLPDHRQTLADTIATYTRDAAYAEFQEHQKGQLRPHYLADMVLLSHNILNVPPQDILQVQPVLTLCDGRIVYEV